MGLLTTNGLNQLGLQAGSLTVSNGTYQANSTIASGYTCQLCGNLVYGDAIHICHNGYGQQQAFERQMQALQESRMNYSGNKPLVVCNNSVTECKDIDEAQSAAERLAHQHQADAYILVPKRKVAPERKVTTTDL